MSKLDGLREELAQSPVRGMSLGYWPEGPELRDCEGLIASSMSLLDLFPGKAGVFHHIMEKPTSKRWSRQKDVDLSEVETAVSVMVDSSKPLSKASLRSRLGLFSIRVREGAHTGAVYFQHAPDLLTIEQGLKVIAVWLAVITPEFGFSCTGPERYSALFHAGQPTSSSDEVYLERIRAHELARHCKPHEDDYLGKRLLDVFELNIISPAHLATRVLGTSLENWIALGTRGTLSELKKDVYAWTVPDDIRPDIRQTLLREGILIVPI